jgi:hypothetical protein
VNPAEAQQTPGWALVLEMAVAQALVLALCWEKAAGLDHRRDLHMVRRQEKASDRALTHPESAT